jgi:hypothetical protein
VAFVDPSGGGADRMTLAIGHAQDGRAVLDCVRERRPPFSPEDVVKEFAAMCKSYRVSRVRGDRYAGEWPRERFQTHGIIYDPAEQAKSDLYRDLLPGVNSSTVELLDAPRLVTQLVNLERRTARGGRDTIDHGPQGQDDLANAVAGVLVPLLSGQGEPTLLRYYREEVAKRRGAPAPSTVTPLAPGAMPYVTREWVKP